MLDDKSKIPFNLDILRVEEKDLTTIKEVKTSQIQDSLNNFHPDGLFSTVIFGNVGTEYRNRMFGYINLKYEFLHPIVYYSITKIKNFYERIILGKETAEWDDKLKDFVPSNSEKADTGYVFFNKYLDQIQFKRTESVKRDYLIKIIEKAKKENKLYMKYLLVLPAGLRDYTIDKNGKPQDDEINSYYRKILFQTSLIDTNSLRLNPSKYNEVFASIQLILFDLFIYLKGLLEGKHKLILGKWLTRKIFNTTRNVATIYIEKINYIKDTKRLSYNESVIGLHQFLKSCMPKTLYEIKTKYISNIFVENSNYAYLTNAKTLKREEVNSIKIQKDIELWTSQDGLEKVVANFGNLNIRHFPIYLNNNEHCMGLIYKDNKYFKFFSDIDELPEGFDRSKVSLVTLAEFLYMSIYHLDGKIPAFITRYPVIEFGSVYPCFLRLKTTNDDLELEELDDNWQPSGNIANSFPIIGKDFFNTTSVHPTHNARLGLDHDGDTLSVQAILSDEAKEEIANYLNSKEYYINSNGKLNFNIGIQTLDTVLAYMTK